MKNRKLLEKAINGPNNLSFSDFKTLVEAFGFHLDRISGSHHIFQRQSVSRLVNIQNVNGKAKPYQIKQFLKLVEEENLTMEE